MNRRRYSKALLIPSNRSIYDKLLLKFERLPESNLAFAPRGFHSFSMAIPVWLREKLFLKDLPAKEIELFGIDRKTANDRLVFSEHHLSYAASAFFPSPFENAAVLTMDCRASRPITSRIKCRALT
ncbi:MAG: carbamoyltransferase N-terminal domain-containing protein, partial [Burkholderiaceae bacterium]